MGSIPAILQEVSKLRGRLGSRLSASLAWPWLNYPLRIMSINPISIPLQPLFISKPCLIQRLVITMQYCKFQSIFVGDAYGGLLHKILISPLEISTGHSDIRESEDICVSKPPRSPPSHHVSSVSVSSRSQFIPIWAACPPQHVLTPKSETPTGHLRYCGKG